MLEKNMKSYIVTAKAGRFVDVAINLTTSSNSTALPEIDSFQ
jgi:hypothetical protein